jgi:hypothetical protein
MGMGMDDPIDAITDDYKSEQELWDFHNQALLKKGIDFKEVLLWWVRTQKDAFRDPRAGNEFDELCAHGCAPQVLAICLALARHSPKLAPFWNTLVGEPEARRAFLKSIESTVSAFEQQFGKFIACEDDEDRKRFQQMGRIPLTTLAAELRFYASLVTFAERFRIDVETRSPIEFARFLLTYYVRKATGRFHDRNVATMFGEVAGLEAYDETAQRMWRDRNYERLAEHHSRLGDLAYALSVVISRQT